MSKPKRARKKRKQDVQLHVTINITGVDCANKLREAIPVLMAEALASAGLSN
jgi:hypothetical protein